MEAELLREWTNRLLDDDAIMCKGWLRLTDNAGNVGHDVWGVLLDILYEQGIVRRVDDTDTGISTYWYGPKWFNRYPPYELLEAIDIPWNAGPSADIIRFLANHNDNGSNFPFIASEIMEILGSG